MHTIKRVRTPSDQMLPTTEPLRNDGARRTITLNPRGHENDFYALLSCYFKYACDSAKGDAAAPLSEKLGGLYGLKDVSIDTTALIISIAVESTLGSPAFERLGVPSAEVAASVDKIVGAIRAAGIDATLVGRAISSIGGMKSARASDRLYALVGVGAIKDTEPKK